MDINNDKIIKNKIKRPSRAVYVFKNKELGNAKCGAADFANMVILACESENIKLTYIKLHKIMFYALSIFVKTYNYSFLDVEFQRWKFGPALLSLYYKTQRCKESGIKYNDDEVEKLISLDDSDYNNLSSDEEKKVYSCIFYILDKIGHLTEHDLVTRTHQDNTAWSLSDEPYISVDDMKKGILFY